MNTTGMRRPGQAPSSAKHRGSQGPRHRLAVARYSATSEDGKATNTPSNNNGMTSTLEEEPLRHTLVRPQVQDDTPAATSTRLHSLNQGLLVRLREEAAERAALQLQLVQAQSAAFQASLTAEGSAAQLEQERNERAALEARNEAQGTNLAMMEAKLGRLWGDVQALETRNMAAVAAQNTLIAERDKLARQMDSMKLEVADVSARGVEAQAASRQALADLEAALETSRRTEQLAREQQASVMNQLSVAQAELADMQQQTLAAMQEAATLRDQLAAVQAAQAIAVLPPPPDTNSAELQEAMQANAQLTADFHQAEASIQNLSSELQAAQDTMRALTQQLSDVRAELAQARTQPKPSPAEEAERQQLTRQLRVLEMQLETSERERKLEVAMVANNAMLARDQGVATQAAVEQLLAEVKSLKEANLALQQHQTREENASAGLALEQQTRVSDLETQLASTQAQLGTELKQARQQLVLEKTASINLNKEVQLLQHRLTISERLLAQRATAGHLLSGTRSVHGSASLPPDVHLTVNRYWAPPELHFALLKALAMREARLQSCVDFLSMRVTTEYEQVVVTAVWQSRSAFEAWSSDRAAGASMVALPEGVMQYPPKDKGEGVPEPYVPFRQYNY